MDYSLGYILKLMYRIVFNRKRMCLNMKENQTDICGKKLKYEQKHDLITVLNLHQGSRP
jgi:hypothetical protein